MNREEKAVELKHSGCNCCQAVLLSYDDVLSLDADTLRILGAGFGSGMGCMEGNCGALIGAVMVDDLLRSRKNAAASRNILGAFRKSCGAVRCADLKGVGTGKVLCSCDDCVRNAVRIVEEMTK